MSKFLKADFYYGAVLSKLLSNRAYPSLVEGGEDRRIYDFILDDKEFRLFIKYRSTPVKTKDDEYKSWSFTFSQKDIDEMKKNVALTKDFSLGLFCGDNPLERSRYAVLHKNEIEQWLTREKTSITISLGKGERKFRVAISDGRSGRDNNLKVDATRIY